MLLFGIIAAHLEVYFISFKTDIAFIYSLSQTSRLHFAQKYVNDAK